MTFFNYLGNLQPVKCEVIRSQFLSRIIKTKQTMKYKGLTADVYRDSDGYDCTGGGISSKHNSFYLLDVPGPFETDNPEKVLKIVRRNIFGKEYVHAEPIIKPEGMNGPMFGGNFIYSCDSRFREVNPYPIPIHDRFEVPSKY